MNQERHIEASAFALELQRRIDEAVEATVIGIGPIGKMDIFTALPPEEGRRDWSLVLNGNPVAYVSSREVAMRVYRSLRKPAIRRPSAALMIALRRDEHARWRKHFPVARLKSPMARLACLHSDLANRMADMEEPMQARLICSPAESALAFPTVGKALESAPWRNSLRRELAN